MTSEIHQSGVRLQRFLIMHGLSPLRSCRTVSLTKADTVASTSFQDGQLTQILSHPSSISASFPVEIVHAILYTN